MARTAFITGITGQDGSYLAEMLIDRGYAVHGLVRFHGRETTGRIDHLLDQITIHEGDLQNECHLTRTLRQILPDEIYNLAADTFIPASWNEPIRSADSTGVGALRLLEAVRHASPGSRFLQASTSEMFGDVDESPQNEATTLRPRNPYACAKLYAHWMTNNFRHRYGMFASSAIMFNHESPRRNPDFVSRKITRTAAMIRLGMANELRLGNLQARRDWGFAGDYVDAMWRMLQHDRPDDFVIGTGRARRVEDFVNEAFAHVGLDWQQYVVIDPEFYRPAEHNVLVADASKAERELGWTPATSFSQLVRHMVDADLAALSQEGKAWRKSAAI